MARRKSRASGPGLITRALNALFFGTAGQHRRAQEKAKKQEHFKGELAKGEANLRKHRESGERSQKAAEKQAERAQRQAELDAARHERQLAKEQKAVELERLAAEKARTKAARERERARKLEEQADRARTKTTEKQARAKANTAERRADDNEDLASRIEGGQFTPGELRELMASGRLNIKTNPTDGKKARRNPVAPKQLERAEESSDRFHGERNEVVELSPAERARLPKYVPSYGRIRKIEIEPRPGSARGGNIFVHAFGDRGPFSPKNIRKALLVWDPKNPTRIAIVQDDDKPGNGEDVHMDESRGIVG